VTHLAPLVFLGILLMSAIYYAGYRLGRAIERDARQP